MAIDLEIGNKKDNMFAHSSMQLYFMNSKPDAASPEQYAKQLVNNPFHGLLISVSANSKRQRDRKNGDNKLRAHEITAKYFGTDTKQINNSSVDSKSLFNPLTYLTFRVRIGLQDGDFLG